MSLPIRIVLVETSHPGNIGAAARAMKNMELEQLVLVQPREFPHQEATARSSGATDVLEAARVVDSVGAAVENCGLVLATTSRLRDQNFEVLDVREAARQLVEHAARGPVAVLFGSERAGLNNEQLAHAHALLRIPTGTHYASLNLAMAVQVVTYEILQAARLAAHGPIPAVLEAVPGAAPLAAPEEMERFYQHLFEVMGQVGFRDRTQSGTHLQQRLRRLFQRARADANEVNILRGILTAVQGKRRTAVRPRPSAAPIYLDYAATTPVDSMVAARMNQCLVQEGVFGNPASAHDYGWQAQDMVDQARAQVAALLGADSRDMVFTSGATESNNLAILGTARAGRARGRHLITAVTEHKSVVDPYHQLEREGFDITWLQPDEHGIITAAQVAAALRADTLLVSIMHANNETGVLQDVVAIAAVCAQRGVPMHVDASQSAGKLPIDVRAWGVGLLSLTAHKLYGPKGIGALYVARSLRSSLQPLQWGGGQEHGLRSGTSPVQQVVGLGAACELARESLADNAAHLQRLTDRLWQGLQRIPGILLNGHPTLRMAGIINVSIPGVDGESLVTALEQLALATGSACNSDSDEPSYVLRALGRSTELAQASLRISVGRPTTERQIDVAVDAIEREVARLRAMAPP